MTSLIVYDMTGTSVGTYEVEPTDLAPRINRQLLHDAVVMYQANRRQGSSKTKSRGEVAGTTKKMYRQKGTGNARAGSRRSGLRRGGGHIHALRPRDYSYSMPRKALQLATRMAVATKIRDGQMVLVEELVLDEPKTKRMARILESLGWDGRKLLITTAAYDPLVYRAARNLPNVTVAPASDLNALLVLRCRQMLITRAALDALRNRTACEVPR
jgi:large subunit ribosomal protein L4